MPKQSARDHWLAYSVGIVLVVLAAGFTAAWFYLQREERLSREVAYLGLPEITFSRGGYSIAITLAIQTSAADMSWAARNKQALEQMMKQTLLSVDPAQAHAPHGLQALQKTLRETGNAGLNTTKVQEVLVTDFLVSEGDL